MQTIRLELTLEEVNLILKALGNMPFKDVYELIGVINAQANEQLTGHPPGDDDEEDDPSKSGYHEQ